MAGEVGVGMSGAGNYADTFLSLVFLSSMCLAVFSFLTPLETPKLTAASESGQCKAVSVADSSSSGSSSGSSSRNSSHSSGLWASGLTDLNPAAGGLHVRRTLPESGSYQGEESGG